MLLTTSEELSLQGHVIERVDGLIVVGLDLSCTPAKQQLVSLLSWDKSATKFWVGRLRGRAKVKRHRGVLTDMGERERSLACLPNVRKRCVPKRHDTAQRSNAPKLKHFEGK